MKKVHILNHTRDGIVVHAPGCKDLLKTLKRAHIELNSEWTIEVPEGKTIEEAVVADLNESFGWEPGSEDPQPWHDHDVRVLPCALK